MKGWLMLVAAAMVLVVLVVPTAVAQVLTPTQCNNQKNDLKNTCRNVALVLGKPSAACCQLVRAAKVDCVCQFVTPKLVAALGGADRTIALIRGCGRTIPRNFKCGSVTTPP
ncbi:hypothetical protein C2S52_003239 [Perilla frutescens var. hirtella]|nr:hypothetical protein C2S51_012247 [Perilla frutescens var. frutescens]KAH6792762.1 hypothetical protein C2S52_003239 [Perilla frutescens var. hirtella]